MEQSGRRVTLSGEWNLGSPGGRSEPRLGNTTIETKRARGGIKSIRDGFFWKEVFTADVFERRNWND